MATYLYGLIRADRRPRDFSGTALGGAPLRLLACGELVALVSTVPGDRVAPTLESVQIHDHALGAAVRDGLTVVAVRFGQLFAGDDACCRHIAPRAGHLLALLTEYDACVEMRVLIPAASAPVANDRPEPATSPGRAYLESLRSRVPALPGMRAVLGDIVRSEVVEPLPHSRGYTFVHVVERAHLDAYRTALSSHEEYRRFRVVGPLALYTIVGQAT